MLTDESLILPEWPAPDNVKAIQTTRRDGVSLAPYYAFNLSTDVNDHAVHVSRNRQLSNQYLPSEPILLCNDAGTVVMAIHAVETVRRDAWERLFG